ncbi:MAG: 30S ribosomal protein S4 [Patescibacteria group bacterium]
MARYTGPKARRWRRLGQVPPDGSGTAVTRRSYPPGQHGLRRGARLSEFGTQLREKQKARYTYGLLERQFRNYYRKADRQSGITGENLMRMLELRLDNVIFRLGIAETRAQARQFVGHGHVRVNGRKVKSPSYAVSAGDEITLAESFAKAYRERTDLDALKGKNQPDWLQFDATKLTGKVIAEPGRQEIDATINEQLIVEFYSR